MIILLPIQESLDYRPNVLRALLIHPQRSSLATVNPKTRGVHGAFSIAGRQPMTGA